jgi:hypothetical protein
MIDTARRLRTPCAVGLALSVAAFSRRARADDAQPDQKAAAQALFEEGRTLVEQGRFADACPKLAESERLDPGIGTMLWLADCYENSSRTASAWASFKEAAAAAAMRHDERERVARERAARLEPKLTRLTITVPASYDGHIEVRRDGVLLGGAEWGVAIPVDPGAHTVTASAAGRRKWSTTVELSAGADVTEVTIPPLASAPPESAAPGTAANAGATTREPRDPEAAEDPGRGARIAGVSVAVVGLAATVGGAFLAFQSRAIYEGATNSGDCHTDNECNDSGIQQRHRAFDTATAATVTLGVGAAAIVGGAVLFFAAPHNGGKPRVALAPTLGGAVVRGWF